MRIAIIGTGHVGTSIGTALLEKKHEVIYGSRNPRSANVPSGAKVVDQAEAAKSADIVVMAIPYSALSDTVNGIGADAFSGKTVIDVSNVYTKNMEWAFGFSTSGAEELAKLVPDANVVKAFNTIFAKHMRVGALKGEKLTLFMAGDSKEAKARVKELGESIGFDVVDAGKLRNARYLEALGMMNIDLGFNQKLGEDIGFRLVR
ncbi:MAG: NADPH-dependent F420 reductase [Candidatus Marsarchaeota archaeon]|nr:NADPH-dependent F420 reductase [Candidatus Marsarchaeota archaeon]